MANKMDNDKTSTRDFEFDLIWEYFIGLDRQGPGSPEVTKKALSFIDNISDISKIADLGCGTGGQTMILAQNTRASITALDLSVRAIDKLNENAVKLGLVDRINTVVGSMDRLPFQNNEFDIIWSEGAIDGIGFEKGINYWKDFLKKDGYIAVTNLAWFTDERPAELEEFYLAAVPDMASTGYNISILQKAGFMPVAAFALPENCFTYNYFDPQAAVQEMLLNKYKGNKTVEAFIANCRLEAELYSKYKKYYGYVFYIGKKI